MNKKMFLPLYASVLMMGSISSAHSPGRVEVKPSDGGYVADNLLPVAIEQLNEHIQGIPDWLIQELDPCGKIIIPDPMEGGISYFVRDALQEMGRSVVR